jgi:hypothetical protein
MNLNSAGWSQRFLDGGSTWMPTDAEIISADFNGDGLSDLAMADSAADQVLILINQGGTLVLGQTVLPVGGGPYSIIAVDLDRDGAIDLVTANSVGASVSVLRGRGDGTFDPEVSYQACSSFDRSIKAGDFNGDGIPDLVLGCGWFFAGIGDGGLLAGTLLPVGAIGPTTVADFNRDGILDLILGDYYGGTASLLLGAGDGGFSVGSKLDLMRGQVFDVASGDLDGDGLIDVAVQSSTDEQNVWKNQGVTFLKGLGNGMFGAPLWLPMGDGFSGRMASVDLVGDGTLELLASNSSAMFQLTFADGGVSTAAVLSSASAIYWPTIGDFNGDHAQDLALVAVDNSNAARIAFYINGCP